MKRVILGGILAAQMVDGVVGATVAGLVLAKMVRPTPAPVP